MQRGRQNAARFSSGGIISPDAPRRLEGGALRQSLADVRPESFGAVQSVTDLKRHRRDLDAARAVRAPALPSTFPSGAELAAQEAAEEATTPQPEESRIGRLLKNVREQASRAFGKPEENPSEASQSLDTAFAAAAAPAIAAAEKGYGLIWDEIQGSLETLAFTWVALLIAGPASLIVYLTRLIGGHVVRPKLRGVQIIPPYTIASFVAHTLPNILIAIILGILTLLIILLVDLINNKCSSGIVQATAGLFKPLVDFLAYLHLC